MNENFVDCITVGAIKTDTGFGKEYNIEFKNISISNFSVVFYTHQSEMVGGEV